MDSPSQKRERHSRYMSGKMIEPLALEGNEDVEKFIKNVFGNSGYNARRLAEACDLFSRMLDDDATICLTLAGAMTPIGMSGPISMLMESGFVDFVISTGANLYHDLHRPYNYPVVQGDFNVDDEELNKDGVARIYDTFIEDVDTLMLTDRQILDTIQEADFKSPMSTAEFHNKLGRRVLKSAKSPEKSMVANAAKYDVPIYTSSPGDSSIGMNMVLPYLFGHKTLLDPVLDIIETTSIVRFAKKNGVVIVGGGSPKNFYMQTQPTLWQILCDNRGGHDYFIQLTTDTPQWGGLSGATPHEAKSWGKVRDPNKDSVVVYSCASITLPLLCQYARMHHSPKKRKGLYAKREQYIKELFETVLNNDRLMGEIKKTTNPEVYRRIYAKQIEGRGKKE